jgi:transcriptional regulator with XRE-family HTH domain
MARGPNGLGPQRGLGKATRSLRAEAQLTQKALAEKSGISASWLSRIEDGQVDPTWGAMRLIASGLGVSLKSLSELAEDFESQWADDPR